MRVLDLKLMFYLFFAFCFGKTLGLCFAGVSSPLGPYNGMTLISSSQSHWCFLGHLGPKARVGQLLLPRVSSDCTQAGAGCTWGQTLTECHHCPYPSVAKAGPAVRGRGGLCSPHREELAEPT